jgi:anthranilate phosphoribosyltransferase
MGVYSPELAQTVASVIAMLGATRAFVVHGAGGVDELSPAGVNLVYEVVGENVRERTVDPAELGIRRCEPEDLRGGDPTENADSIRRVLAGENGAQSDAILLNAAAAIAAGGRADDLADGLELAREAVASGAAAERLEQLAAFSREDV